MDRPSVYWDRALSSAAPHICNHQIYPINHTVLLYFLWLLLYDLGSFLLTWINFNSKMDKLLHPQ